MLFVEAVVAGSPRPVWFPVGLWRTVLGMNQCCRTEIELGQLMSTIERCVRCHISERGASKDNKLGQLTPSIELCVRCRISELANEESNSMQVRAYFTPAAATLSRGRLEEPIASSPVGSVW